MESTWYAVRCVFRSAWLETADGLPPEEHLYEERMTLWQATSSEEAIALAESEAADYAGDEDEYLELAQAFRLFDAPANGAEIFSLMRSSPLESDEYLDAFFDTGAERAQVLEED
jgi:hypothetical protein